MVRTAGIAALLALLLWLALPPVRGADAPEISVLDAPRGAWLATVRADAALTVLQESGGWKRVRLEGWVPSVAAPGAPAARGQEAPPPAPPVSEAVSAGRDGTAAAELATVKGLLSPRPGDASNKPGSGLLVLLVSDVQTLDAERDRTGSECRADVAAASETENRLKSEYDRVLNSNESFRDATSHSDRLKSDMAAAARARVRRIEECRRLAEEIYQRHAIQRAISDDLGRFEFREVPPGRHRVVATEPAGDHPRAWSLECSVTAGGTMVLDPRRDASPGDPFWGLK